MFKCHLWTHINQLAFQGNVISVIVPSQKGPTKISAGYCPIVLRLVKGTVRVNCENDIHKTIEISGGTVSVSEKNIVILPHVHIGR